MAEEINQEIVDYYNNLRSEISAIHKKLTELDDERKQHCMVLDNVKKVEPERTAYQMIGGVLIKKTVSTVIPSLDQTISGLTEAIGKLVKVVELKEKQLSEFMTEHKELFEKTYKENEEKKKSEKDSNLANTGVLV